MRGDSFSTSDLLAPSSNYIVRKVHPTDLLGGEAKTLINHHLESGIDYKRVAAAHWSLGIRHGDLAGALDQQSELARRNGDGSENDASRAYHDASIAHRSAMQRHYDAGNLNDGYAYSADKVEGGADSERVPQGNALYATKQAAAASKNADDLTATAEKMKQPVTSKSPLPLVHKFSTLAALASTPMPGRYQDADPTAEHMQQMANVHAAAAGLYQSASDAYHAGDADTATSLYGQASAASARAHEMSDEDSEE